MRSCTAINFICRNQSLLTLTAPMGRTGCSQGCRMQARCPESSHMCSGAKTHGRGQAAVLRRTQSGAQRPRAVNIDAGTCSVCARITGRDGPAPCQHCSAHSASPILPGVALWPKRGNQELHGETTRCGESRTACRALKVAVSMQNHIWWMINTTLRAPIQGSILPAAATNDPRELSSAQRLPGASSKIPPGCRAKGLGQVTFSGPFNLNYFVIPHLVQKHCP